MSNNYRPQYNPNSQGQGQYNQNQSRGSRNNNNNRGRNRDNRGRNGRSNYRSYVSCTICGKNGHEANVYWYRFDYATPQYAPPPPPQYAPPPPPRPYYQNSAPRQYYQSPHPYQPQFPQDPQAHYANSGYPAPTHFGSNQFMHQPSHMQPPQAYFAGPALPAPTSWLPDSRASHHVTANPQVVRNRVDIDGASTIYMGNGQAIPIKSIGCSQFHSQMQPHTSLVLKNLLLVPHIMKNLLSVSQFA